MILGIESSTREGSFALCDETGEIVHESTFTSERAHNSVIFDPLEEILATYRSELKGIAVGLGPGSYGGVRVAISVANGISLVLGIPTIGISSLEALAVESDTYLVAGDARRGTYFLAYVQNRALMAEPDLLEEEEAKSQLLAETNFPAFSSDQKVAEAVSSISLAYPSASSLCRRAQGLDTESWTKKRPLEPHYLRAPYITTPKK